MAGQTARANSSAENDGKGHDSNNRVGSPVSEPNCVHGFLLVVGGRGERAASDVGGSVSVDFRKVHQRL